MKRLVKIRGVGEVFGAAKLALLSTDVNRNPSLINDVSNREV